ncbi:MAG: hypothetical protein ACRC7O_13780 [Fimbriiglobus sp.]
MPTADTLAALQAALGRDVLAFAPELAVAAGVVLLLLARLTPILDRVHLGPLAVTVTAVALGVLALHWNDATRPAFSGLLTADPLGEGGPTCDAEYCRTAVLSLHWPARRKFPPRGSPVTTIEKPLFRPEAIRPKLKAFTPPPAAVAARPKLAAWAGKLAAGKLDKA